MIYLPKSQMFNQIIIDCSISALLARRYHPEVQAWEYSANQNSNPVETLHLLPGKK